MAEIQGALKKLDVSRSIPAIVPSKSPAWLAAIRGVAAQARSERPRTPRSATPLGVLRTSCRPSGFLAS